ncbi:MoaD/ThiS family protein [Nocardia asiatica]|uniref:MoaD/ThiS family protein n=1 Tax=Nocardia asiatica TaxID=209252 RepID=UPI003EE407B3
MSITVIVPTVLRSYTGGEKRVEASGTTLREIIADLDRRYSGISKRLLDDGKLNRFVNIYIDDDDVRFSGGLDAVLPQGGTVSILSAVAGGSVAMLGGDE